jgi:chemotaxis protein MotB
MRSFGRVVRFVLVAMAVAGITAGCGVSKSKYMDITKERDALAEQNQGLQSDLAAANEEKEKLSSEVASLEQKSSELESQLAKEAESSAELKSTYENLVGKLEGEVSSGKVQIRQLREGINMDLAQDILFASGSANLDKSGRELLVSVSEELKSSPFQIMVVGHTDDQKIGGALASRYPTNWELGAARSAQIVRVFQESGVSPNRMVAISAADSRPRAENATPEGRAQNRRIEIWLRPETSEEPSAAK